MDRLQFYMDQAQFCERRLHAALDPKVRRLAEREQHDWLELARHCEIATALDRMAQRLDCPDKHLPVA